MNDKHLAQNQRIADNIRSHGWHCLHVLPVEAHQDSFTYSIGFGESHNAPEIVIFGMSREKAQAALNQCAWLLRQGHVIRMDVEDGNILTGGYNVIFRSIRSDHFDDYLGTAVRYYQGRPFEAVIMFFPDRQHRFPWDEGYDGMPMGEALAMVR
ncbi:DUF4262 domain-containing protein [Lysobacter brunescens]|uniref:DUF4262 domain-containing protein n=2 Tax=Lysobacter brunescens TaxID=262323 RepID=A0ABW2YHC7_9GAMM